MKHAITLLIAAFSLAPSAAVLAAGTAAIAPANLADVKKLDEVIVTGNVESLSAARNAIDEAENRFYTRYNEVNKDPHFHINCRRETPSDHVSRFTKKVCDPVYVDEATHGEALKLFPSNGLQSGDAFVNLASAAIVRKAGLPELQRRTLELIRKDPELMRALLERARLQLHYDALRKKKFAGRTIVSD